MNNQDQINQLGDEVARLQIRLDSMQDYKDKAALKIAELNGEIVLLQMHRDRLTDDLNKQYRITGKALTEAAD